MSLPDFYPGTTLRFVVTLSINAVPQDIRNDIVTVRLKIDPEDIDGDAVLTKAADVTSQGVDGKALFTLTPTDTAITERRYWWDIVWERSGGDEYVVASGHVQACLRVSDI